MFRSLDVSREINNYVSPGVQHKYRETLVVFVSKQCADICEWCFRKRIFLEKDLINDKIADIFFVEKYLKENPKIKSVLLTGGDSFISDLEYLKDISKVISNSTSVTTIRFATRSFTKNPELSYSKELRNIIKSCNKRRYVVIQAVTPEEINKKAIKDFKKEVKSKFLMQTPLLRGINNDSQLLTNLWTTALDSGVEPYYIFQNRPVTGNEKYSLSFKEGFDIFEQSKKKFSGVCKRMRYVMSCDPGKLEIIGELKQGIILKFHQARDRKNLGKLIEAPLNAIWLNSLTKNDPEWEYVDPTQKGCGLLEI